MENISQFRARAALEFEKQRKKWEDNTKQQQ